MQSKMKFKKNYQNPVKSNFWWQNSRFFWLFKRNPNEDSHSKLDQKRSKIAKQRGSPLVLHFCTFLVSKSPNILLNLAQFSSEILQKMNHQITQPRSSASLFLVLLFLANFSFSIAPVAPVDRLKWKLNPPAGRLDQIIGPHSSACDDLRRPALPHSTFMIKIPLKLNHLLKIPMKLKQPFKITKHFTLNLFFLENILNNLNNSKEIPNSIEKSHTKLENTLILGQITLKKMKITHILVKKQMKSKNWPVKITLFTENIG